MEYLVLTDDKHTSEISKYKISYHLIIALFSCRKYNQEVYFKLMKAQMFSLWSYVVVLLVKMP